MCQIALLLSGRTEKIINQLSAAYSEVMTESARRMVKLGLLKLPPGVKLNDLRIKDTRGVVPKMAIQSAADHLCMMADLHIKLLLAPAEHEFVTSDHPTVLTNQRFQGRTKFPVSGFAMRGIQIVLPVSPSACLFIYDPGCYRVGVRRKDIFVIQRGEDVEALNALQVLNANGVVYFHSERLSNNVSALWRKLSSNRRNTPQVKKFSKKQRGLLFMLSKENVRIPIQWSFCKVKSHAPSSFDVRDSGIVELYQRWSDAQAKRKDRISFPDFLRQRFPEIASKLEGENIGNESDRSEDCSRRMESF